MNLEATSTRMRKDKKKKRELKERIAHVQNFIKAITQLIQSLIEFPSNRVLMSKEQVDTIEGLKHKINVFEDWMDHLVKKGEEMIKDAIGKCKEAFHWFNKSIWLLAECKDHMEQNDIEV